MKRIVSGIMPILLILGALTIAFNVPPMKADADPLISGTVRDTVGNPVPDVLIVAQDVTTEEDVASAISNATGAYSMTVPQGTYNLIVTPPPESGFAPTTISNIEITQDCVIDIVLVSVEELVNVSGVILDRDGNPVPNQWVYIGRSAVTDENGRFSINVPVGEYVIELCNWWSYAQNVPLYYHLYGKSTIKITEDASFTIVLQNRYISGKTINSEQNPISGVSINVQGYTDFGDFYGWFESWASSDEQGNFNVTVFTCPSVRLEAHPQDPYASTIAYINASDDVTINITLQELVFVNVSGFVLDRDGNPVPNQWVYIGRSAVTDENGRFSINVPVGEYVIELCNWWSYAQNVPLYYHLYGKSTIKITEDMSINITLENRYISGKVDCEGRPVSGTSIYVSGYTDFGDFYGWFESWTSSDEEGMFNVTVFISTNVNLIAHPPDPYAEYTTNIDATEDTTINVTLKKLVFVNVSGFVLDRDGNPVPNQWVYIGRSAVTDENGRFSINVPVGEYVIELCNWWSYAQNVPLYYHLYGKSTIKITEDMSINITLENRYISGKVDCEGRPVSGTSIYVSGYTDFGDFYGWFESWTSSDTAGKFSVAIFTCPNIYLEANPPEIYAPVRMYIDATNDKTVLIALSYKTGVLPIADFIWNPEIPEVGQMVTFNASLSVPGSGIIIRHKWSFGDGTYAVGKIVTHTYSSPGIYTVTLNVTNSKGLWSIVQKQIEVLGLPGAPVANFTYTPVNPIIGQIVTFDASSSYDPDGIIVSYNWDFGDGYKAEGAIVTHSYEEEGNYKVTLTVVDNDGKSSTISRTVTVVKPTTPTIETSGLVVIAKSPVDLIVYDPDFYVISREWNEIPGATYSEEDLNGDGSLDAYVIIPEPKIGQYLITVTPKSDANPYDTYTLEVSYGSTAFLLAENVPVSDIPTEPYLIHTTTFMAPPTPTVITAEIDVDPDTLNLGSKGKWITTYIELPEGFDVADINVSTILLNSSVSVDFNAPTTIGDYDSDSIPDLMIKFSRADVISYILANVDLAEHYENRFITVTLTITGKLNDDTPFQGSCTIRIVLPTPRCGKLAK